MKIFDVERVSGEAPREGEGWPLVLIPDSAVTRPGVPLFVPPFAEKWQVELVPVFEIGRLGKCIDPKFALRYVDAMCLGVRLVPDDGCVGAAQSACFDGALCLGQKFPFEAVGWEITAAQAPIGAKKEGSEFSELSELSESSESSEHSEHSEFSEFSEFKLGETISSLSQYCTLKTGDLVIPLHFAARLEPVLDTRITASLNGHADALSLKIK